MSQQNNIQSIQKDGRIDLALQAYLQGQFRSAEATAKSFNINPRTLRRRVNGVQSRRDCVLNGRKLTQTEEQTIIQYILDLDSQGFPPQQCKVEDMANKLLGARGGELVGKY